MNLHPTVALIRSTYRVRGFSQKSLAEKAGVSQTLVSKILCGKRGGSFIAIESLLGALGYNLEITDAQEDHSRTGNQD